MLRAIRALLFSTHTPRLRGGDVLRVVTSGISGSLRALVVQVWTCAESMSRDSVREATICAELEQCRLHQLSQVHPVRKRFVVRSTTSRSRVHIILGFPLNAVNSLPHHPLNRLSHPLIPTQQIIPPPRIIPLQQPRRHIRDVRPTDLPSCPRMAQTHSPRRSVIRQIAGSQTNSLEPIMSPSRQRR